jgi:hypothetical protein
MIVINSLIYFKLLFKGFGLAAITVEDVWGFATKAACPCCWLLCGHYSGYWDDCLWYWWLLYWECDWLYEWRWYVWRVVVLEGFFFLLDV